MANETIYIVDEIVTRPGEGRAFLDVYMKRYAPAAQARGLTLDRVLVSPPLWLDDQSNILTITWTLQGAPAWWQMSFRSRTDPSVTSWWAEVDEKVVSRKRSYMSAAADIEALTNV
jgi:hypothetical protein